MRLNSIHPAEGSRTEAERVGRGHSSGNGKTGGRGHKSQKSRSGGFQKVGFEGGQMPLQRRVPKVGFRSRRARYTAEVRLSELKYVSDGVVDLAALKQAGVVAREAQTAKIIASGEVAGAYEVRGVAVTPGARASIEKAGGRIEA